MEEKCANQKIKEHGYKIEKISYDLHEENIFNIMTEYEEKFSKLGPIYKLVVTKK